MRKIFLAVLLAASSCFAVNGFTYKWTIADGDTVTKTKWKANNDSVLNWATRLADTLNTKYVRFTPSTKTHDSTLKYINIDTVRSGPDIDTIKNLKRVTGKTTMDTVVLDSVNTRAIKSTQSTVTGTITVDSVNVRAIGSFATRTIRAIDSIIGLYGTVNIPAMTSQSIISNGIKLTTLSSYADSAAARAGGITNGIVYRIGGTLKVMY
jgi:hypothetical protein